MLNMFPDEYNLARSGRKTADLLEGPRVFPFDSNQSINTGGLPTMQCRVRSLVIKQLADVDEKDADACGFASFHKFQNWVVSNHEALTPDSVVTIVHFERVME